MEFGLTSKEKQIVIFESKYIYDEKIVLLLNIYFFIICFIFKYVYYTCMTCLCCVCKL